MRILSKIFLYFFISIFSLSNIFCQNSEAYKVLDFLRTRKEYKGYFCYPVCSSDGSYLKIDDFSPEIGAFISEDELRKTIVMFAESLKDQLTLNGFHEPQPYIQRLTVRQSDKVAVIGDIHGSCHSLCRNILTLIDEQLLDTDFKLEDNAHIVFTGDIADRGRYGVECWYFLMRLKIENPDRVFILKGNHESYGMAMQYGFAYELARKYNEHFILKDCYDFAPDIFDSKGLLNKFHNIFQLLPQALYVGNKKDGFIQCCHGGLPIPHGGLFVNSPIGNDGSSEIDANKSCLKIIENPLFENVRKDFKELLNKDEEEAVSFKQTMYITNLCFGDFGQGNIVNPSSRSVGTDVDSFEVGNDCALEIMNNRFLLNVKAIFRGHQHCYCFAGNQLDFVCNEQVISYFGKGRDVFKSILDDVDDDWTKITKPVYTFMSCPEGSLGIDRDGFGILNVGCEFEDWNLMVKINELEPNRYGSCVHIKKDSNSDPLLFENKPDYQGFDEQVNVFNLIEEGDSDSSSCSDEEEEYSEDECPNPKRSRYSY